MKLVLLALAACGPPVATAPNGPIAADHLTDGSRRIREPGWFAVDLPANPTSKLVPDNTSRGPFAFKQLHLQTPNAMFDINYAEFRDYRDRDELKRVVPNRYLGAQTKGMRPLGPLKMVPVEGGDGGEIAFQIEPKSELNASDALLDARVQLIWRGNRFVQLSCAAPEGQGANCDRFFSSFKLE